MKNRLKRFALCAAATACMAFALVAATGCMQQSTYTPDELTPTLSTPTIGEEGVLRVGVNTSNVPMAGSTSSSSIVGIDVDVAAALADQLGLKLEVVDVGTSASTALTSGQVDIVMGIGSSSSSTNSFWTSDPYLATSIVLFSTSASSNVANASSTTIAAQVSSTSAWAVTNTLDSVSLTTSDDLAGAFAYLADGTVQYVAADAIAGTYSARNAGIDVQIVALLQQQSGYSVGVLDANTELKQAVSNALATIASDGTVSVIEAKWLGEAPDLTATSLATTDGSSSTSSDESLSEDE